jgi:hypothetical protein
MTAKALPLSEIVGEVVLGFSAFTAARPAAVAAGQETAASAIDRITTSGTRLLHRPELSDAHRRTVRIVMFQTLHEIAPMASSDCTGHA